MSIKIKKLLTQAHQLDRAKKFAEADTLMKLAQFRTEGHAESAEMQGITDSSKSGFALNGLFKRMLQSPISFVSRLARPETAIEAFLKGADIKDLVSRASIELDILQQRMTVYAKEFGMNRLRQLGPQEILRMMNDAKVEAIYYSNQDALAHERRHQQNETSTPEKIKENIMQRMQSVFPPELPPEERERIVGSWMENYVHNLKQYYSEDEISGELGAERPVIEQRATEELPKLWQGER